jgi:transposase
MDTKKILIGSRIPESVIIELRDYCKSHGILMNHFVSEAIKEKLKKVKRSEEKAKAEKLPIN